MNNRIFNGYWKQQRNSVKTKQSTTPLSVQLKYWMSPKNLSLTKVLFLSCLPMLFLLALILMWATITFWILMIGYDFYHKVEKKIPFDLEFFNKITGGGSIF